jgi:hypothetical protein
MSLLSAPLLLLTLLAAEGQPAPKLPLGKETTCVTDPLDREGYLDYQAALNGRLGKGITPGKNANALLWKALGPRPEGGTGMPPEFFRRLGIEEPPPRGDYLIGFQQYLKDHLKLDQSEIAAIYDQHSRALKRPWNAKDYPHVAAWLKANEKPLAVVVEATKRPDYFNPLVTREHKPGSLLGALLPGVQKCREAASALACRAMLRLAEGKDDDAWQDLIACHRLGRLVARGATLIEFLVGVAIDAIASNADLAYLERARLTTKQIQDRLKDLQALPPLPPVAGKIDLGERFTFLDCVQLVRRGGIGMMEGLAGGPPPKKPDAKEEQGLASLDWGLILRNGNRWYDRMAAALRLEDRAAREKAFARLEEDLTSLKVNAVNQADVLNAILEGKDPGKQVSRAIGNVLIGLLIPAVQKVQSAHDRAEQIRRNLQVAFALAAYHRDHGRYPAKLDALAPAYLKAVPNDLFSGKPLVYKPSDKGYLLYSVGPNGKDDGGRWYDDNPPGDDPRVRVPLPELKKR